MHPIAMAAGMRQRGGFRRWFPWRTHPQDSCPGDQVQISGLPLPSPWPQSGDFLRVSVLSRAMATHVED